MLPRRKIFYTIVGYSGLLQFAVGVCIIALNPGIPPFQVLAIAFSCGGLVVLGLSRFLGKWGDIRKMGLPDWALAFFGVCVANFFWIFAMQSAPPEQAELVIYTTPILTLLFTVILLSSKEIVTPKRMLAVLICFSGIFYMLFGGKSIAEIFTSEFTQKHALGLCLAFFCAITWALYAVFLRKTQRMHFFLPGLSTLIGAPIAIILHCSFETWVPLTAWNWGALAFFGIFCVCLAQCCWGLGMSRGHFQFLDICSYGNPIVSISMLILLGVTEPTPNLAISCLMITVGTGLAGGKSTRGHI